MKTISNQFKETVQKCIMHTCYFSGTVSLNSVLDKLLMMSQIEFDDIIEVRTFTDSDESNPGICDREQLLFCLNSLLNNR